MYVHKVTLLMCLLSLVSLFLFTNPAITEIYTLSLHDALPILMEMIEENQKKKTFQKRQDIQRFFPDEPRHVAKDRKSTRLNSSHVAISYAVFCLKKKNSRAAND